MSQQVPNLEATRTELINVEVHFSALPFYCKKSFKKGALRKFHFNPLQPDVAFLYPLKTSENYDRKCLE